MKKVCLLVSVLILIFCAVSVPAMALEYINDAAGVLTAEEVQQFNAELRSVNDKYNFDAVIVTVNDTDGYNIEDYADDYFDYNGYGRGEYRNGILMLISVEPDERYISTSGECIHAFNDDVISYIGKDLAKSLNSRNYKEACEKFIKYANDVMAQYSSEGSYKIPFSLSAVNILVIMGISALVAFIGSYGAKTKMNDAITPADADIYAKGGYAQITAARDLFLYSHVTRTERTENDKGGSSTHTSSSGRTHGGGRF